MLGGNVASVDADSGGFVTDMSYQSPSWTVPIRSLDIRYFDGTDWLEEWDSTKENRVPWCVDIRINFARPEEQLLQEQADGIRPDEDPDFEMVVPIPAGLSRLPQGDVVQTTPNNAFRRGK
jgi:hypothetical protein